MASPGGGEGCAAHTRFADKVCTITPATATRAALWPRVLDHRAKREREKGAGGKGCSMGRWLWVGSFALGRRKRAIHPGEHGAPKGRFKGYRLSLSLTSPPPLHPITPVHFSLSPSLSRPAEEPLSFHLSSLYHYVEVRACMRVQSKQISPMSPRFLPITTCHHISRPFVRGVLVRHTYRCAHRQPDLGLANSDRFVTTLHVLQSMSLAEPPPANRRGKRLAPPGEEGLSSAIMQQPESAMLCVCGLKAL